MKNSKPVIALLFLLLCQLTFSQTAAVNSSISIKIEKSRYVISGIVSDENTKREIIEKIKTELDENADFSQLKVDSAANPFKSDWEKEFDKSLQKLKNWKSGVFIFSSAENLETEDFPVLSEEILNIKISLATQKKIVSPADYKDKVVLLLFLESWCGPCRVQADELQKFYSQTSSPNLEIIGVSSETSPNEKKDFQKFIRLNKYTYKFGWIEREQFNSFMKISKFVGVPQSFLIYNGKLHGVFSTSKSNVTQSLKDTIVKTLRDNNL